MQSELIVDVQKKDVAIALTEDSRLVSLQTVSYTHLTLPTT